MAPTPGSAEPSLPSVLLVTSNGTGMGHLTRQLAVATALRNRAEVALLSLSSGLPVVASVGAPDAPGLVDGPVAPGPRLEYLPSYQRPWFPRQEWNDYLAHRLTALAHELHADVIAFDGVAPYRGLVLARRQLPHTAFVWFRRGMWRAGRNVAALRAEPFFDVVIEPGDLASSADSGATSSRDATRIPPVSLLDVMPPLPRDEAAAALSLDPTRPTALVTLGSGALGDTQAAGSAALDALSGWQVAMTRGALGESMAERPGIVVLRDVYPLAVYLNAFDLVVSAAGYNAVHEFVTAGIPTVLIPNDLTATDDQVARARELDRAGAAVWVDPLMGSNGVGEAVARAVDRRQQVAERARALAADNRGGAQQAADQLLELARSYSGDDPDITTRALRSRYLARGAAVDLALTAIGPRLADSLRQRRRARTSTGPTRPLPVDLVVDRELAPSLPADSLDASGTGARPAIVTSRLDASLLRGDDPVEHVMLGTSPQYLARRLEAARSAYDVRSITLATPIDTGTPIDTPQPSE